MDAAQVVANRLKDGFDDALHTLRNNLGFNEEELEELKEERDRGLGQLPRAARTADEVDPTADLDEMLPSAIEAIETLLPRFWVEEERPDAARVDELFGPDGVFVAFRELPRRGRLPDVTRAYSPTMLERVFDWKMDLPAWDGLCCSIAYARGRLVEDVQSSLGLLWSNTSTGL